MKIERDPSDLPLVRNDAVDRATGETVSPGALGALGALGASKSGSAGTTTPSDSLTLSPDAALASEAIRQAAALPDIRHEKVERVRKLLEQGEVGRDAESLADAIIDSLIDHSVDG